MSEQRFDSESESVNNCSICLENLAEEKGTLDCCAHIFCAACIKVWSKSSNSCPLDRKQIKNIYVDKADGSSKQIISIDVIDYYYFIKEFIGLGLIGVPQENTISYFNKWLDVLNNVQQLITYCFRRQNNYTNFVDPNGNVLSKEIIINHIDEHRKKIMDKIQSIS